MRTPTLSSALSVFTTEFEMESGGSYSLLFARKLVMVMIQIVYLYYQKKLAYKLHIQPLKHFRVVWLTKPHG